MSPQSLLIRLLPLPLLHPSPTLAVLLLLGAFGPFHVILLFFLPKKGGHSDVTSLSPRTACSLYPSPAAPDLAAACLRT